MFVTSFLTVLPLVAATHLAVSSPTGDGEATELRVHDVRALVELQPQTEHRDVPRRLVPLMHVVDRDHWDVQEFEGSREAVDQLLDVFTNIDWNDDWSVDLLEPGEIHLDAPREAHERLARLIETFEAAAFETTGAVVRTYSGPATLPSGVVSLRVLEAELSAASVEVRSRTAGLDARWLTAVRDTATHTATVSVDCEIAQSAPIHHGRVREVVSGLELELGASLTRRGARLTYLLRSTQPTRVEDAVAVACATQLLGGGDRPWSEQQSEWNEDLELTGGGAFGTAAIGTEEALVLRLSTDGASASYCAIHLDPRTRTWAEVSSFDVGAGHVADVLPASSGTTMELAVRGSLFVDGRTSMGRRAGQLADGGFDDEPILGAAVRSRGSERFERIRDRLDTWYSIEVGSSTVVIHESETGGALGGLLDIEAQTAPARLIVEVSTAGAVPLAATTVCDGGSEAAVVIGRERLEAESTRVEVAQNTSALRPYVMTRFDGLALAMTLHTLTDGRLGYRLRGQLCEPTTRRESTTSSIDRVALAATDTARLVIDERGVARPTGDGAWTIVVGDGSGVGQSVTLRVSAKR
ncbi:MAG: hypothetical protein AAGI22_10355 [Planctomycetota bacterium]